MMTKDELEMITGLIEAQDQRLDEFQAQIFMICVALILILPAVMVLK